MGKNMEHEMAIGFVIGLIEIEGRLRNLVIPSFLSYLGMLRAQIHENNCPHFHGRNTLR